MYLSINNSGISFGRLTKFANGTPVNAPNGELLAYGISTDTRTAKKGDFFVALRGENFDGHRFLANAESAGCAFAVVDHVPEGCAMPFIVVDDTTKALGRIAKAYKGLFRTISLAVTGSVGKTTTKEFIYSVLSTKHATNVTKGNFNNEIGLPLTLFGLNAEHKALLVEMGMNHKGEISALSEIAEPDIAVITTIGTSHIEHLGSRENIRDAKMEIIHGMKQGGILILNGDEPLLHDVETGGICKIYVGTGENSTYKAENIRFLEDKTLFDIRLHDGEIMNDVCIHTLGAHNVTNALIACVCGILLGISEENIRAGLLAFTPAAMRQHFIEKENYTLIEDCYNASPESMKAGLEVLSHTANVRSLRPVAVLGDMLELGAVSEESHFTVGTLVADKHIAHLVTYGEMAKHIARGAMAHGMREENITILENDCAPDKTAQSVSAVMQKGDVVLFKASRAMALERIVKLL